MARKTKPDKVRTAFSSLPEPVQVVFIEFAAWIVKAGFRYVIGQRKYANPNQITVHTGTGADTFCIRWDIQNQQFSFGEYHIQTRTVGLDDPRCLDKIKIWVLEEMKYRLHRAKAIVKELETKTSNLQGSEIGQLNENPSCQ